MAGETDNGTVSGSRHIGPGAFASEPVRRFRSTRAASPLPLKRRLWPPKTPTPRPWRRSAPTRSASRSLSGFPPRSRLQSRPCRTLWSARWWPTTWRRPSRRTILYREQHSRLRDSRKMNADMTAIMNAYLDRADWRVNENANVNYSLGGLILHSSGTVTSNYWLNSVYTPEVAEAHRVGLHAHSRPEHVLRVLCRVELEAVPHDGSWRSVEQDFEQAPQAHEHRDLPDSELPRCAAE